MSRPTTATFNYVVGFVGLPCSSIAATTDNIHRTITAKRKLSVGTCGCIFDQPQKKFQTLWYASKFSIIQLFSQAIKTFLALVWGDATRSATKCWHLLHWPWSQWLAMYAAVGVGTISEFDEWIRWWPPKVLEWTVLRHLVKLYALQENSPAIIIRFCKHQWYQLQGSIVLSWRDNQHLLLLASMSALEQPLNIA